MFSNEWMLWEKLGRTFVIYCDVICNFTKHNYNLLFNHACALLAVICAKFCNLVVHSSLHVTVLVLIHVLIFLFCLFESPELF